MVWALTMSSQRAVSSVNVAIEERRAIERESDRRAGVRLIAVGLGPVERSNPRLSNNAGQ